MTKAQQLAAAFLVVVNAVVTLLVSVGAVSWSDAQVILVYAAANTGTALLVSLYLHFQPGTSTQPVAVQGSLIAFAAAVTALLSGFGAWSLTAAQNGYVVGVVVALVALVSTTFARAQVTAPVTPALPAPVPPPG